MSINMNANLFKLLTHFRRQDLSNFKTEHDILYDEAVNSGDHLKVTSHYYSVMSTVIDEYFGGNFHFVPPSYEGQPLEDALKTLHRLIGEKLGLKSGVKCLDIGCGIGGVMIDIADMGAEMTGVTIAPNEAEIGNEKFAELGIADRCRIVAGDCHDLPFDDNSFDVAYAIYSLKYIPKLEHVMKEIARVLKPGGKLIVYDLIKTNKYDGNNPDHKKTLHMLEYACGMPELHTQNEVETAAESAKMTKKDQENLEETFDNRPFHYCFSSNSLFMWLISTPVLDRLIKIAEALRILPKGFEVFNRTFLCGTVQSIVDGGKKGILSGADILLFEKH
ncbi:unnamed protein product [Caenorhabditis bovis]|uniref:SAM-dependent methyltransferase Erg6/SMT-type domain-containing protein n=1 Tax=Caenorhabditis bovis TaxID=2654633 RepID=A0A8S1ER67_9PELO|nr:unnamed protein product [Caenorhabditis bovis]